MRTRRTVRRQRQARQSADPRLDPCGADAPSSGGMMAGPLATYRVVIRFDPGLLTANRRMHWSKRHRLTSEAKWAALIAWKNTGAVRINGRARLNITVCRARALDYDNALSGCKAMIDGVFSGGMLPDDSMKWLDIGSITQDIRRDWKGREQVIFDVEELNDKASGVRTGSRARDGRTR